MCQLPHLLSVNHLYFSYNKMETFDLQQIINLIPQLTGPASIVLVCFFLYKAGILGALTSWVTRQPNNGRIDELEAFRSSAETNHFCDLENLKEWRIATDIRINKLAEDMAWIRGKIGNGK